MKNLKKELKDNYNLMFLDFIFKLMQQIQNKDNFTSKELCKIIKELNDKTKKIFE